MLSEKSVIVAQDNLHCSIVLPIIEILLIVELATGMVKLLLILLPFTGTIGSRFQKINLENVEENRRLYRQLLFQSSKEMGQFISGVIQFHETFYHKADDGTPLPKVLQDQGIIPGIKVDKGTVKLGGTNDEFTTQGKFHKKAWWGSAKRDVTHPTVTVIYNACYHLFQKHLCVTVCRLAWWTLAPIFRGQGAKMSNKLHKRK